MERSTMGAFGEKLYDISQRDKYGFEKLRCPASQLAPSMRLVDDHIIHRTRYDFRNECYGLPNCIAHFLHLHGSLQTVGMRLARDQ